MSPLLVHESHEPFGTCVTLSGRADLSTDDELARLATRLSAARPRVLVIDLSGLETMTSLAIGHLVSLNHAIKLHGGQMALAGARPPVRALLAKARLDTFFPMFESAAEAARALGAAGRA